MARAARPECPTNKQGSSNGNRHGEVVQRRERLRVHHAGRRQRGPVRPFFRDQHAGLQDPEGRSEGELRRRAGPEGQAGVEHPEGLTELRFRRKRPPSRRPFLFLLRAYTRSIIALPNSEHLTCFAPVIRRAKSYVTTLSAIARSIERTMTSAASTQPMWRSIISAERISEPGLT